MYQAKDVKINTTDETEYASQLGALIYFFLRSNKGTSFSPRLISIHLFGDNEDTKANSHNVAKVCKHLYRFGLIKKGRNLPMKSHGIRVNIVGFYYE